MLISLMIIRRTSPRGTEFFERLGRYEPHFTKSQESAKRFERQVGYAYLRFLQSKGFGYLAAEFVLEDDNPPRASKCSAE
jgi:hypothetical protein